MWVIINHKGLLSFSKQSLKTAEQDLSAFPSRASVQQMEIAERERGIEKSRDRDDAGSTCVNAGVR